MSYAGSGNSLTNNAVFACPADDFNLAGPIGSWFFETSNGKGFCRQTWTRFSSYAFKGMARGTNNDFGMAQKPFSSVREPSKTELIGEISGYVGLSSHDRLQPLQFPDARNVMSFVAGHVNYVKIYWN